MKKLSAHQRRRHLRRIARLMRRRKKRDPIEVSRRRARAYAAYRDVRLMMPSIVVDFDRTPGRATFDPPADFSFISNYEETLAFVLDMREMFYRRRIRNPANPSYPPAPIFADFSRIQSIHPGAGIVLAAEIDRCRIATGRQPRSYDSSWQPAVRQYFSEAGLFQLLGIQPQLLPLGEEAAEDALQTLKFVRGRSVYAKPGAELRDRLETLSGRSLGPRPVVYEAIAEAIANTRHAYPPGGTGWPFFRSGRWWAAGTWCPKNLVVSMQLYDQGVGIPATLPKSEHWSDILAILRLPKLVHPERDDARLLEAALALGRTSTRQSGRGKGLVDMAAWIDLLGNGFLRITSGRGMITYKPGGHVTRSTNRVPFAGTLIEWEIGLRA